MPTWTTPEQVIVALGPGAAPPADDEWLQACCDAANAAAYERRRQAGHVDVADADVAPSADVAIGATMWAEALWRERASTDTFASFTELGAFQPTGGTWATIRRMLHVGRAQVDTIPAATVPPAALLAARYRRRQVFR